MKSESETRKPSPEEVRYRSLLAVFEGVPTSLTTAIRIVGGRKRLERLMTIGAVRYVREPSPTDAPNKKARINIADCIRNTKPRLLKIHKFDFLGKDAIQN